MTRTTRRQDLRKSLRARRDAMTAAQRIAAAEGVDASLARLPAFVAARRIAGYWAIGGELPLINVLHGVLARGQVYHLPLVQADRSLQFAAWRPGQDIALNALGIPEPTPATDALPASALDVMLLPLVGFDRQGRRLGFGGGYYDRALHALRARRQPGHPLLVGIGYAAQQVDEIAPAPWDVHLDYVATETELIDCWHESGAAPEAG